MYQINPTSNEITQLVPKTFKELGFTEVAHLQEWIAKMPESLGEEFYSFRPNGASYVSLGQRPRKDQPISQALKGRSNAGRRLRNIKSPFQGLCSWVGRLPRVSPWANVGDTVGVWGRRCVGMMFPKMEMVSFEKVFLEAAFESEIEAIKRM